MKERCRSCWWHEGGRCYNEDFAVLVRPNSQNVFVGELIDNSTDTRCLQNSGYLNKREALSAVIPNDKLTILSERRKKK